MGSSANIFPLKSTIPSVGRIKNVSPSTEKKVAEAVAARDRMSARRLYANGYPSGKSGFGSDFVPQNG